MILSLPITVNFYGTIIIKINITNWWRISIHIYLIINRITKNHFLFYLIKPINKLRYLQSSFELREYYPKY